jgi:tetratricopeptide (TPR) repeat protein
MAMLRRLFGFSAAGIFAATLAWSSPSTTATLREVTLQSSSQSGQSAAQENSPPSNPQPQSSSSPNSSSPSSSSSSQQSEPQAAPPQKRVPNLAPPRSDSVNADALNDEYGQSSSKDTQIDLSPPADDVKAHPDSSEMLSDVPGTASGNGDVTEFHPWNPHKAAKDVEVGDFYFKRKNYRAAEDRYREALLYKNNDAIATYRLAVCLEKLDRPDDARQEYESYLKILPHGPQAEEVQKSIDRLKNSAANAKPAK